MTASPALKIAGTANFRDLGGYPVPGGRTRSGVVFRSDALSRLGDLGRSELRGLGIRRIVDLRDPREVQAMPDDITGLGIDVVALPIFAGSPEAAATGDATLETMYRTIIGEHADTVVAAVRALLLDGETPSLVHCTAGKDRTGAVSAILLLAVGVELDVVLDDYEATSANLAGPWLEGMMAAALNHGIAVTPQFQELMSASPRAAMAPVLGEVLAQRGGIDGYLERAGLSSDEVAALRDRLVEPEDSLRS